MRTVKTAVIASALLGLFALAEVAQAGSCATVYTHDNFVALRTGPGTGFQRIRKLWYQTVVHTNRVTASNWIRVKSGSRWGWVHQSLVDCY